MKKTTLISALVLAASMLPAEELLKNGGFEQISSTPKSSSKHLMMLIRKGWDFGPGPVVKSARGWTPSHGKIKQRLITVGPNGENKENVFAGKNSLYFQGTFFHMYQGANVKPGKYKLSFSYKGKGRVSIVTYSYGKNPDTGKKVYIGPRELAAVQANPQWQTFTKVVEAGKWSNKILHSDIAIAGSNNVDFYIDNVSLTTIK